MSIKTQNRFITAFIICLTLGMAAVSCAEEKDRTEKESEELRIQAHIAMYYNDTLHKSKLGAYWGALQKGKGKKVCDTGFVYIHKTVYNMYNDIISSTREDVNKTLGKWDNATHYAPEIWYMGMYNNMVGLEDVVKDMCVGDCRRIILPTWLSGDDIGSKYLRNSTTFIYDLEVTDAGESIEDFEIELLEKYKKEHYPQIDSMKKGFYKVTLRSGTIPDSVEVGSNVRVLYTAKFLDGFVFETNIKDTAIFYNVYNSGNTYGFTTFTVEDPEKQEEEDDMYGYGIVKMNGLNRALTSMRYGEKALFFFNSDYGYGAEGTTSTNTEVPAFTPIILILEVPEQ